MKLRDFLNEKIENKCEFCNAKIPMGRKYCENCAKKPEIKKELKRRDKEERAYWEAH
jgi:hypothetical protein